MSDPLRFSSPEKNLSLHEKQNISDESVDIHKAGQWFQTRMSFRLDNARDMARIMITGQLKLK